MTGADTPPVAEEAREAAFAAWYQAHPQPEGCDLVTHDAWQAGWAAALHYAAQHLDALASADPDANTWFTDRYTFRAVASLLRGEGGGT